MASEAVTVYCDGSLTDSELTDVFTSRSGTGVYVARAVVVIPALDVGLVKQTRDGVLNRRGNPTATEAEVFAIRSAIDLCRDLGVTEYRVLSDCRGAVLRFPSEHVEWRSREQMRLPNDFFDKVIRRARYLRKSSRMGVTHRLRAQPHQMEAFKLFNASHLQFMLSGNPLWERVLRDARRHPESLGAEFGQPASPGLVP